MPQPSPSDVHNDAPLTNLSIAFLQKAENFVAGQVFPTVPVAKQSDIYYVWDRNNFYLDQMEKRGPATESAGGGVELTTDSYRCDVWALHKDIDDQTRANSDTVISPDRTATNYLTQQGLIRKDKQWAADYFVTGIWTNEDAGGTDFTQWDDAASDPEKDIAEGGKTMLQNTGYEPNVLVVSYGIHLALKRHPLVKDRFKYTSSESITAAMLAQFFEIERYVVAKSVNATNAEGAATDTYDFILGDHALLAHAAPSPGIEIPSAGYNFVWSGLTGMNDLGLTMSSFRLQKIKSDRLEIEMAFDMKLVAADLGFFFLNAIA